jgi:hypothetical protein
MRARFAGSAPARWSWISRSAEHYPREMISEVMPSVMPSEGSFHGLT